MDITHSTRTTSQTRDGTRLRSLLKGCDSLVSIDDTTPRLLYFLIWRHLYRAVESDKTSVLFLPQYSLPQELFPVLWKRNNFNNLKFLTSTLIFITSLRIKLFPVLWKRNNFNNLKLLTSTLIFLTSLRIKKKFNSSYYFHGQLGNPSWKTDLKLLFHIIYHSKKIIFIVLNINRYLFMKLI